MTTARVERWLAAILAADVVGYSRLMERDEQDTSTRLRAHREELFEPAIEKHQGRVFKLMGDGLLAEFGSVVDAVECAVLLQREMAARNSSVAEDRRMQLRIGINLGDVIVEGGDIYGDGVNIAARLQASAAPGGIVISSTVYDQVRNKVAVGFEFLGPLTVKNVDEGVPSYAVKIGDGGEEAQPAERPTTVRPQPAAPVTVEARPAAGYGQRLFSVLGVIAAVLVGINLLTWNGVFWARFPLLALIVIAALAWNRDQARFDRRMVTLAITALGIIGINVLTWSGTFWAVWPILGIAAMIGLRWAMRR
jgi:adenylate cyclase